MVAWIGFAGAIGASPLVPFALSAIAHRGGDGIGSHSRVATIIRVPAGETYAYRYPSMSSPHAKKRAVYREGDTVEVVCQIRDGEPVTLPGDGRPNYAVRVWDQLPNGSWIPDIFTSLEGKRGDKPPAGLGLCAEPTGEPVPAP
ncbi:hypothetical protein AB0C69_05635 [Actinomadura sp. NPDC048032]|uniref:hypothetical protein n=1 Tax=Actinomadura sp. NPDC048032 TaxID=3155747 RepID=UPI0033C57441